MWVNTEDRVFFGRRCAIAVITRSMFIDLGFIEMDIRLFARLPEFNESFVRNLLKQKYGDVSKWQLHTVIYNIEHDWLDVVAGSPDFDEVPDGCMLPRI